jgi:predicted O-methyltransferase YrrM
VLYNGDAGEILQSITGSYDMVFLDGPKGQYIHFLPYLIDLIEGAASYMRQCSLQGLVDGRVKMRRNSLTMVNNLRQFIDEISNDKRFTTQIFNIGDGVSVSCKK